MGKKEFILQGFTTRTHGDVVRELFDVADIQRVVLSVAFVSESGVREIEAKLNAHGAQLRVFAGIRNDITSHQGLARLHSIPGSTLYVVDTGARNVLFHPKLYLARGKARARLVIGSANLTLGGLNNNIEASMMLDFDLDDAADAAVVDGIEATLAALPAEYPFHIAKIKVVPELDALLASGRLIDETALPPPRPRAISGAIGANDAIPLIKLKVPAIHRLIAKATALPKKAAAPKPAAPGGALPGVVVATTAYEPVWQSKPLSRRSLTIPTGANSNPTGSTTLGKGLLSDIDPVTYFRKQVFGHLAWKKYNNRAGNVAERVDAQFDLILKGLPVGTFTLTLRHSLTRAAAAPADKNLPTELSWNDARQFVTRDDLIGRTLSLYRDVNDRRHFALEID
ncbi:MAG: hypothetical protein ACLQE9_20410 [Roseiarcus sp.]